MKHIAKIIISSLSLVILCFVCSLSSSAQGKVKNGVVIDKKAQGIITSAAKRITNDSPISFLFSSSSKGQKTNSGSVLLWDSKYSASFAGNSIYCDGKSVWTYNPKANEVNINDVDATGNDMMNISSFINGANKNFRAKLIRQQATNYILDLTPNRKSSISKVRLSINTKTYRLKRMEVHYYSGNTAIFNISNYKAKAKCSASSFTFPKHKYPKAQIVDLR